MMRTAQAGLDEECCVRQYWSSGRSALPSRRASTASAGPPPGTSWPPPKPTAVTTTSGADAWLYVGPDERGRELEIIALEVHPADGGQSYLLVIHVMPTQLRGDRS